MKRENCINKFYIKIFKIKYYKNIFVLILIFIIVIMRMNKKGLEWKMSIFIILISLV